MSLTITHAGGTRVIDSYVVPAGTREWAYELEAIPEAYSTHGIRVWGDRLERPSALVVEGAIPAATLAAAYRIAYTVVNEAETATVVQTHLGTRAVDGLLGFLARPERHNVVLLTLRFMPTGAP